MKLKIISNCVGYFFHSRIQLIQNKQFFFMHYDKFLNKSNKSLSSFGFTLTLRPLCLTSFSKCLWSWGFPIDQIFFWNWIWLARIWTVYVINSFAGGLLISDEINSQVARTSIFAWNMNTVLLNFSIIKFQILEQKEL